MYNAIVIGAGSIGAWKPEPFDKREDGNNILTHAHAYYVHPKFNLIGIVDINEEKARQAAEKWETKAYTNLAGVMNSGQKVDCISICVDTKYTKQVLEELQIFTLPRVVIIEKPAGDNEVETIEIQKIVDSMQTVHTFVNYSRRYNPIFQRMKLENSSGLQINDTPDFLHCRVSYNRGLLRDGCHALDICRYLFGNLKSAIRLTEKGIADYDENDPTHSYLMQFEHCPSVLMQGFDGRTFSIFEFDLFTKTHRYQFINNGANLRVNFVEKEKLYGNYSTMTSDYIEIDTKLSHNLYFLLDNIVQVCEHGKRIACTVSDALEVHKMIKYLRGL